MNEDNPQKLPTTPLQDALAPQKDFTIEPKDPSPIASSASVDKNQHPHTTETPQKAIRTYESDVADVLAHKNISTTNIALAEKRKKTGEDRIGDKDIVVERNKEEEGSHVLKKILIALASLILIGVGATGGYYLYTISPLYVTSTPEPQVVAPVSIVPADNQVTITIDNLSPTEIIQTVRAEIAKPQANSTIKEIILVQNKNGQKFRVNSSDMITSMDISAPDILVRALSNDWMLGVYANNQGNKDVFVVADVDYFQNAFAGMLQWESYMPDDLKQYLYQNTPADISSTPLLSASMATTSNTSTSTSTSTSASTSSSTLASTSTISYQASPAYNVISGSFTDKIIQNNDVREFVTSKGVLFLYSFIDNNKLILTGSESTLSEVLNRLEQNAFVR